MTDATGMFLNTFSVMLRGNSLEKSERMEK